MDPLLPESSGVNAFQLAVRHPSVTLSALSLSVAMKKHGRDRPMLTGQCGGGGVSGGGGGGGSSSSGGSGKWALRKRAPTAGSAMEGRSPNHADEKNMRRHATGEVFLNARALRERWTGERAGTALAFGRCIYVGTSVASKRSTVRSRPTAYLDLCF